MEASRPGWEGGGGVGTRHTIGSVELGERAVDAVVCVVVFLYAGELADPDVVPPVGGWFQDNGVPMFVEWRAVDDSGHEWPLHPGGAGDLARSLV